MNDLKLKGGALIIGSLFWQDDLKVEDKDGIRKKWRNDFLEGNAIRVKLPIRYGRFSKGGIITMVFSKNCEKYKKFGTGFIKAFKSEFISNWEELENLSFEMSKAEGMNGKFIGGTKNIWGTMSILFNSNKIDLEIKDYLIDKWSNKVREDGGGNDIEEYKFDDEESALKKDCSLNFDWFESLDKQNLTELNDFDFVICTVTKQRNPNNNNYPTLSELATSVKNDKIRKYFKNNVASGITTFEDKLIKKELDSNAIR